MQQKPKPKNTESRKEYGYALETFKHKHQTQLLHYNALKSSDVTLIQGPSGVGKSYVSLYKAATEYTGGKSGKKIILTRSLVGVDGEDVGALKGSLQEKLDPWFEVQYDILCDIMGKGKVDTGVRSGNIIFRPLMFLRGATLDNCNLICTETQNLSLFQIKALLTRQGEYANFILEGDNEQCDLPDPKDNGFKIIIDGVKKTKVPVPIITYTPEDCVRSGTVKMWLEMFRKLGI